MSSKEKDNQENPRDLVRSLIMESLKSTQILDFYNWVDEYSSFVLFKAIY